MCVCCQKYLLFEKYLQLAWYHNIVLIEDFLQKCVCVSLFLDLIFYENHVNTNSRVCKYNCKIAPKSDLNWNLSAQKLSEKKY